MPPECPQSTVSCNSEALRHLAVGKQKKPPGLAPTGHNNGGKQPHLHSVHQQCTQNATTRQSMLRQQAAPHTLMTLTCTCWGQLMCSTHVDSPCLCRPMQAPASCCYHMLALFDPRRVWCTPRPLTTVQVLCILCCRVVRERRTPERWCHYAHPQLPCTLIHSCIRPGSNRYVMR